jgi:NADH-quinone oxidoreductase subunit H
MMSLLSFVVNLLGLVIFPGFVFVIGLAFVYEWLDRKFYARFQNRIGPLYTGRSGFLQPFADFVKLLAKEDITPQAADSLLFSRMPILALTTMLVGATLLPIVSNHGILSFSGDLIIAVALMTIYCIIVFLAGISSTNRFSSVGAERAVSQLLGYEIPMTLAIAGVALNAGSIKIADIVQAQAQTHWYIFGPQALGFGIFLIAVEAELERIPFDIPEAEQEIVAGWLTEFTGRKLALFRLSRDVELLFVSGLVATLYLGGPTGPVVPGLEIVLYPVYFIVKTAVVLFILSSIRTIFARIRIDQMVNFSWKYLVPLSLFQLLLVRIMI